MGNNKFNLSEKEILQYNQGMNAFLAKHKISADAVQELQNLTVNAFTNSLSKHDIFIPCNDGSGEIYNRNSGARYTISKTGKKEISASDPEKTIGLFTQSATVITKAKTGSFHDESE